MSSVKGIKDEIAGHAERHVGEIIGDQKLHDEGVQQEQRGREEKESGDTKPLGNLNDLT
jgi:uncharacterized protein YjbJ (UPF0337 family)